MKHTIITITAILTSTAAFAQTPNNYIGTNDNGVISERVGNNANNIITRDMVTQDEFNREVSRLDAEDMRVHGGEVRGDTLVLTVGDHAKSRGRNEVYTKEVGIDVSSLRGTNGQDGINGQDGATGATGATGAAGATGANGNTGATGATGATGSTGVTGDTGSDGTNGTNGQDGATGATGSDGVDGDKGDTGKAAVAPLGALSFAAASASFYGDGIGFGLSNSNYGSLEGSIAFGFDLDNDWRVVAGITTDFKGKTAGSIGVGVSF